MLALYRVRPPGRRARRVPGGPRRARRARPRALPRAPRARAPDPRARPVSRAGAGRSPRRPHRRRRRADRPRARAGRRRRRCSSDRTPGSSPSPARAARARRASRSPRRTQPGGALRRPRTARRPGARPPERSGRRSGSTRSRAPRQLETLADALAKRPDARRRRQPRASPRRRSRTSPSCSTRRRRSGSSPRAVCPLRIALEREYRVPPLAVPDAGETDSRPSPTTAAVRLYVERARRSRARTSSSRDANAGAVARICRALDGLPLAIELAAARVRVLGVEGTAKRLGEALVAAHAGRRRICPSGSARCARRSTGACTCSIRQRDTCCPRSPPSPGGATLEALEAVADTDTDVAAALEALLDASLVTLDAGLGRAALRDARDDPGVRGGRARARRPPEHAAAAAARVVHRARGGRRAALLDAWHAVARPRRARARKRRARRSISPATSGDVVGGSCGSRASMRHFWRVRGHGVEGKATPRGRARARRRHRAAPPGAAPARDRGHADGDRRLRRGARPVALGARPLRRSSATRSRSDESTPSSARWRTPSATHRPRSATARPRSSYSTTRSSST